MKSRCFYLTMFFKPCKPLRDIVDCIHRARVNGEVYHNRPLSQHPARQSLHLYLHEAPIHPTQIPPLTLQQQTQNPTNPPLPSPLSPSPLILPLRRLPHRPHHPLNHRPPNLLPALPQPDAQIGQQGRVAHVRGVRVAVDVGRPVEFGRVGVAGADVAGLQRLELLLGAEFVGLEVGEGVD